METTNNVHVEQHKCKPGHFHGAWSGLWFAGWLFTIGFLHLEFWKGVLAIILWPYYLGAFFSVIGR